MRRPVSIFAGIVALSMLMTGTANASEEKFVRSKPHVNIGTIGHTGASESAVLSLRTVDLANARGQDAVCVFAGSIRVSVPVEPTDPSVRDHTPGIAEWEPLTLMDVRVREGEVLQMPLELPSFPTGPIPLRQTWLVEVVPEDRARPVGESCDVEWGISVFDPATGESRGRYTPFFKGYRPQFY